jgi:N-acetyl sugar amidotransferase
VQVKYGLPAEVKFCRRCVISNQRPSSAVEFAHSIASPKATIHFDDDGVCAACRYAERKAAIDWDQRERQLQALCSEFRSRNGSYDCLVPGSGGKDSVYASHILKTKYGMRPLTVTWAPHLYTDVGFRNFQNWLHIGGFDNYLFTPDGRTHRLLTRLAFDNLLHPFQPFILGQKNYAPRMAQRMGIPLVFYGESEAEYGNDEPEGPDRARRYYVKGDAPVMLGGVPVESIPCDPRALEPYLPVDSDGLRVCYLGYYIKWVPQECYYYAAEHTAFEANDERTEGTYSKYNSIDDKTDPFHYWTTLIKFGIGRATYDAAQEIRSGHITRSEGVALVRKYDTEFPARYFPEFLDYLGMDRDTFFATAERFKSPHLWDGNRLRHVVCETATDCGISLPHAA